MTAKPDGIDLALDHAKHRGPGKWGCPVEELLMASYGKSYWLQRGGPARSSTSPTLWPTLARDPAACGSGRAAIRGLLAEPVTVLLPGGYSAVDGAGRRQLG